MGCGKAKKYNPGGKVKGKSKKRCAGQGVLRKVCIPEAQWLEVV